MIQMEANNFQNRQQLEINNTNSDNDEASSSTSLELQTGTIRISSLLRQENEALRKQLDAQSKKLDLVCRGMSALTQANIKLFDKTLLRQKEHVESIFRKFEAGKLSLVQIDENYFHPLLIEYADALWNSISIQDYFSISPVMSNKCGCLGIFVGYLAYRTRWEELVWICNELNFQGLEGSHEYITGALAFALDSGVPFSVLSNMIKNISKCVVKGNMRLNCIINECCNDSSSVIRLDGSLSLSMSSTCFHRNQLLQMFFYQILQANPEIILEPVFFSMNDSNCFLANILCYEVAKMSRCFDLKRLEYLKLILIVVARQWRAIKDVAKNTKEVLGLDVFFLRVYPCIQNPGNALLDSGDGIDLKFAIKHFSGKCLTRAALDDSFRHSACMYSKLLLDILPDAALNLKLEGIYETGRTNKDYLYEVLTKMCIK